MLADDNLGATGAHAMDDDALLGLEFWPAELADVGPGLSPLMPAGLTADAAFMDADEGDEDGADGVAPPHALGAEGAARTTLGADASSSRAASGDVGEGDAGASRAKEGWWEVRGAVDGRLVPLRSRDQPLPSPLQASTPSPASAGRPTYTRSSSTQSLPWAAPRTRRRKRS
jgi:hypothetical protein